MTTTMSQTDVKMNWRKQLVTGVGLIARQPHRWTGPLCLGLMTAKVLLLTVNVLAPGIPARVPLALTVLILVYMAGVLADAGEWLLAGGAVAAGVLVWQEPGRWDGIAVVFGDGRLDRAPRVGVATPGVIATAGVWSPADGALTAAILTGHGPMAFDGARRMGSHHREGGRPLAAGWIVHERG